MQKEDEFNQGKGCPVSFELTPVESKRNDEVLSHIRSKRAAENFLIPDHNGYCISSIPATLGRIMGGSMKELPSLPENVLPDLPENPIIFFLTVDSLGYFQLASAIEQGAPVPVKHGVITPITSVFPATTASALSSLNTGVSPSVHGIMGCRTWLREYGMILNTLAMSPEGERSQDWILKHGNFNADDFVGVPSTHSLMSREGLNVLSFVKDEFSGRGISHLLNRDADCRRFIALSDLCTSALSIIENNVSSNKPCSTLLNAYWDLPDRMGHAYGIDSNEFYEECIQLFSILRDRLFRQLSSGALERVVFALTADHGQVPIPNAYRLEEHPFLMDCLAAPPYGEYRATFLIIQPGKVETALNYINREMSEGLMAFKSSDLVNAGVFGDADGKKVYRAGDLTVMSRPGYCLQYAYPQSGRVSNSISHHGATTEKELIVPFFVARAEAFLKKDG